MTRTRSTYLAFIALLLSPMAANAIPIEFDGHYYEVIIADGISWADANTAAMAMSFGGVFGHLATITSAAEDQFIDALRAATPGINTGGGFANSELWVGGFQPAGSTEPGGGWTWVNGEGLFTYTNWLGGEPNNVGGAENYLAIGLTGQWGWNDEGNLDGIYGYVVEYDVPEPGTLALLGIGLAAMGWSRRKRTS